MHGPTNSKFKGTRIPCRELQNRQDVETRVPSITGRKLLLSGPKTCSSYKHTLIKLCAPCL